MTVGVQIPWGEDERIRVKKLYLEGKSASEISALLKGKRTRSAIIGLLHRMGVKRDGFQELTARQRAGAASGKGARAKVRKPPVRRIASPGELERPAPRPAQPSPPRAIAQGAEEPAAKPLEAVHAPAAPHGDGFTIVEMGARQCKWPYGDGPFSFCGRAVHEGERLPYCEGHAAKAVSGQPVTGKELARSIRRFI